MIRLSIIILTVGILLGLGLGILLGWVIAPVKYIDTDPATLRADYKDEYITLVASAYIADHNLERARHRIAALGTTDPVQVVDALAQRLTTDGKDASILVILASDLRTGGQSSASIIFPITRSSSPLTNIEFSNQAIEYPPEWPAELFYPEQFIVVDASSGMLPEGNSTGWSSKMRYSGDPKGAADLLSFFFREKGWQVEERIDLDEGGILMILEKSNTGSGILVIDRDAHNSNYTNIIATILP